MKELHNDIVRQYATQWNMLGLQLGLKEYDIANIFKNNERVSRRVEACCTAMLEQWLTEIPLPTWGKLDDAIGKINLPLTDSCALTTKEGNHGYFCSMLNYVIY